MCLSRLAVFITVNNISIHFLEGIVLRINGWLLKFPNETPRRSGRPKFWKRGLLDLGFEWNLEFKPVNLFVCLNTSILPLSIDFE
jgi:hypothetical protein